MLKSYQYFALSLCVFGAALVAWHVLSWIRLRSAVAPAAELAFRRRQLVRRLQASSLIVLLGVAILAADVVPDGMPSIWYWSTVMLVVFWMSVLALADILATQSHLQDEQAALLRERHRLEHEARELAGEKAGPLVGQAANAQRGDAQDDSRDNAEQDA